MFEDNKPGCGTIIILIIALIFFINICDSCDRDDHNMVLIRDGYCYDRDTKIIYIESDAGRYTGHSYSAYYDVNGNLCKYNIYTGEFIPIEKEGNE